MRSQVYVKIVSGIHSRKNSDEILGMRTGFTSNVYMSLFAFYQFSFENSGLGFPHNGNCQ